MNEPHFTIPPYYPVHAASVRAEFENRGLGFTQVSFGVSQTTRSNEMTLKYAVTSNFLFFPLEMVRSGMLNYKQEICLLFCSLISHMHNPGMTKNLI